MMLRNHLVAAMVMATAMVTAMATEAMAWKKINRIKTGLQENLNLTSDNI